MAAEPEVCTECSQYAFITLTRPDSERHAISSVAKYFIVLRADCDLSDQATEPTCRFIESAASP